jgi:endonuclease YncB( thermonuclease family)
MRRAASAVVLILALGAADAQAAEFAGAARVVDGATLEVAGKRVALYGVEAPPAEQSCREWSRQGQREFSCGALSRAFLQSLVSGREVFCVEEGPASKGEVPATCFADGRDLAAEIVLAGWGVSATGRYVNLQQTAQQARSGLWAGPGANPDEWRRIRGAGR